MALTRKQQKLLADIRVAYSIARIDPSDIEEYEAQWRTEALQFVLRKVITGYVLQTYTFIDEQMSDAICRIYFKNPGKAMHFGRLWKTKRFRSFVHNALDNLYPLHKMRLLHDIKPVPSEFRDTIQRINDVRNALAHSFFPENRRNYREHKKLMYRSIDLFTLAGLERFEEDRQSLVEYLWFRCYGKHPTR
jgi:hypothetical protein